MNWVGETFFQGDLHLTASKIGENLFKKIHEI